MPALNDILRIRRAKLEDKHLFRELQVIGRDGGDVVTVTRGGRQLISFSSNDYLGLTQYPQVMAAARHAIDEYGTGAGASRLITGNHPLYVECEEKLAEWKGTEAACIFGSGYLANIGTITSLMGKDGLIIADKLSHACLLDGARLSSATLRRFAHNSVDNCANILEKHRNNYNNCLLITEAVFSMDGDTAPLEQLIQLAEKYDSWLLVDEAHVVGTESLLFISKSENVVVTSTLSKALGSYGGYVCGSQELADYLKSTARSLVYSTALPASVIAAASAALDIVMQKPELIDVPLMRAKLFTSLLDLPVATSAIVPLIVGDTQKALNMSYALEEEGFLVSAIRPPTVPPGTARLRFTFSALHSEEQVRGLAQAVRILQATEAAA